MSAPLPRVLRRALGLMHFAANAVGASASSIFLVGDDRSIHGLVSDWDWTRTSFPSRLDDWPSVAAALADGELRRIDASEAQSSERGWFEARGIATTVCIPLHAGDRPLGVLFFDFAIDAPLGSAARALLGDVGRRCSRALARASLSVPPPEARWVQ